MALDRSIYVVTYYEIATSDIESLLVTYDMITKRVFPLMIKQ